MLWEKVAIFLGGLVLGFIFTLALERKRFEVLLNDIEEVTSATVFILDRLLTTLEILVNKNNSEGGGAA